VSDERAHPIGRRDEVLELMYWLEGEQITQVATVAGMARFLVAPEADVAATVRTLVERGDVEPVGDTEFRLTAAGRVDAKRRFAETFAGMTDQGHGECNDPSCDCHTNPNGAAECHAHKPGRPHDH
jgi:hypothetical protein